MTAHKFSPDHTPDCMAQCRRQVKQRHAEPWISLRGCRRLTFLLQLPFLFHSTHAFYPIQPAIGALIDHGLRLAALRSPNLRSTFLPDGGAKLANAGRISRPASGPSMFLPVQTPVDPALLALAFFYATSRATKDMEKIGVGPPRGGSSRVAYREGKLLRSDRLAHIQHRRQVSKALRTVKLSLTTTIMALKEDPVRGSFMLFRNTMVDITSKYFNEEQHVAEVAVIDDFGTKAVEQVGKFPCLAYLVFHLMSCCSLPGAGHFTHHHRDNNHET